VNNILVVDDEIGNADALAMLFEDEGFRVVCAYNGQEALDRVAEQMPDVVVMDFMMPVMNGCDAAKALRADEHTRHIRILMHSSMSEQNVRGYFADYDAFLRKPCSFDDILAVVKQLLGRRK
jgi:CheY-like chemotaxis protein